MNCVIYCKSSKAKTKERIVDNIWSDGLNFSFCVPQKKESDMGLAQTEGE